MMTAAAGLTGSRAITAALFALLLAAPVSVTAPAPAQAQAETGSQPPRAAPDTFQFALANGMQVLVIPDTRAPVVTQMLWFKVGAMDDPQGLSGLAHFFEHMMFRGTKAVPGDQFAQRIAKNGGETNAFTTHDYTAFYEQIARDRLGLAMQLEADRLHNLNLTDATVGPERDVVMEERRMRVDNDPQALTSEQMEAALHLSHPYGRPVIGWMDEIRHIDKVSAQDFYDHHYAPNNCILVIAGDVTPDEVRKMAQQYYGPVPARALQPRAENAEPPRLAETRMTVVRADAKVPIFSRIYRTVSYATAKPGQAEALEVYAQELGGDQTSVLYQSLVEQKKLASDVGASYDGMARDAGEFSVYAVPRPGVSLETLEKAVDQILATEAARAPATADVARAKTQLIAATTYRRDSQFAMATAYGQALAIGMTANDVRQWPERIGAVSARAIRDAAASLSRKDAVSAYLVPKK